MWRSIRFRSGVAFALALVAASIVTCAAFAPLYERAVQQALVHVKVREMNVAPRGLQLRSTPPKPNSFTESQPPLATANLVGMVPPRLREFYEKPIGGLSGEAGQVPGVGPSPNSQGRIIYREAFCRHVSAVRGRCPTARDEVMISEADVRVYHLDVGSVIPIYSSGVDKVPDTLDLTVVGVYRQRPSSYWFDERLTGFAGAPPPPREAPVHDLWLTVPTTIQGPKSPRLANVSGQVSLRLRLSEVDADTVPRINRGLDDLNRQVSAYEGYTTLAANSSFGSLADDIAHQVQQPRKIVPLLLAQLALLGAVILWLVLGAAVEQRRPEIAVAYLRGRSRARTRRALSAELLIVTLAGVPVGVAAALGLGWAARFLFLPGRTPFELPGAFWITVLAAVGLVIVLVLGVVVSATREDLSRLLRRVKARRSGWAVGIGEALVLAVSGTAVIAFVTSGLGGPLALFAPLLLALFVGLVLAHLVSAVAASGGRRLLRAGRPVAGVGVLDAARSGTIRRMLAILTVAVALVVFCADADVVADRNRALATGQEAGAPLVAEVAGNDVESVRAVLSQLDPRGEQMTPVVSIQPTGRQAAPTVGVVPQQFARIASFGSSSPKLPADLGAPDVDPVRIQGDQITADLASAGVKAQSSGESSDTTPPVDLRLQVLDLETQQTYKVTLARISLGTTAQRTVSTPVSCRNGCALVGVEVLTLAATTVTGQISLGNLRSGEEGAPVAASLGDASDWLSLRGRAFRMIASSPAPNTLGIDVLTDGSRSTVLRNRWLPASLAVVASGTGRGLPRRSDPTEVAAIDGVTRKAEVVGHLPRIPGSPPYAALVDLDAFSRGAQPSSTARVMVWFRHDDRALLSQVRNRLGARGVSIASVTSATSVRRDFEQSATAWSITLALVVAVVAMLVGLLVIVILSLAARRQRARDLAALMMAGWRRRDARRVAALSAVVPLLLAAVAGVLCGLFGAQIALPSLPIFAHQPLVSTLDLSAAWGPVLLVGAGAAVLLVLTGLVTGRRTAAAATPDLLREPL